ncbi:Na+/H+ antiporter NhaA [Nakamurella multipartita]|uniref:Na(+)/H(+) antiporter NhaA n=1 Tax=Nakamurella multipartita (strain ATCC 700099 / DSM 44233 / CIP 104796 / JCM 9543 / NBRC 105858 / Y-104) TaxID=479431 RepID=C8X657_NAKMY|nr:Na+/H+ antiporter NhaA [Nakamurella multipartita]ACV76828.1 Na+/H+ antiporter NhaA [Nakamurella multipartita DSM 44233]
MVGSPRTLFSPGTWAEDGRVAHILRKETVGGGLLLLATVVALVWANTAVSESYFQLLDTELGPAALHLNLTVGEWAGDGLLAIFFFVAGLELKREFVAGDLRDPHRAVVPVAAAFGGMIVPALLYLVIAGGTGPKGWAIPTATDIAFALAVLAVISTHLPAALRTFLLTLAVVDDLLAITIIAVFYTDDLQPVWLLLALAPLALFTVLVQRRISSWWLLLPLAFVTWSLVHASGVHATVAGVLLGFAVPVRARKVRGKDDDRPGMAEHFEHLWRPISAGIAVPVFALFSAGVAIGGWSGLRSALTDPIAVGIIAGLVLGKPVGILTATYLTSRLTRRPLQRGLTWPDLTGVALLGGVGFTVSLLIGELAFGGSSAADDHVKIAVLAGSVTAAVLAAVLLRMRNRRYRAICEEEERDDDHDGIPDIYQMRTPLDPPES